MTHPRFLNRGVLVVALLLLAGRPALGQSVCSTIDSERGSDVTWLTGGLGILSNYGFQSLTTDLTPATGASPWRRQPRAGTAAFSVRCGAASPAPQGVCAGGDGGDTRQDSLIDDTIVWGSVDDDIISGGGDNIIWGSDDVVRDRPEDNTAWLQPLARGAGDPF